MHVHLTSGHSLAVEDRSTLWNARPTWPAQAADWPRLTEARGSLRRGLALKGSSLWRASGPRSELACSPHGAPPASATRICRDRPGRPSARCAPAPLARAATRAGMHPRRRSPSPRAAAATPHAPRRLCRKGGAAFGQPALQRLLAAPSMPQTVRSFDLPQPVSRLAGNTGLAFDTARRPLPWH